MWPEGSARPDAVAAVDPRKAIIKGAYNRIVGPQGRGEEMKWSFGESVISTMR